MARNLSVNLSWILLFVVVLQVAEVGANLGPVKRAPHQVEVLSTDAEPMETQIDYGTELDLALQQLTYLRNKASVMNLQGDASCLRIQQTLGYIKSVTSDLQRIIDSDQNCPPVKDDLFKTINSSPIFTGSQANPMSFLSSRLSKFTKATRIFTTRTYLPSTRLGAEFHAACDNIPNTLVIIKSGNYIAGGYTEVAWESPSSDLFKASNSLSTFLFSVSKQKTYTLKSARNAIICNRECGPVFGYADLRVDSVYSLNYNLEFGNPANSSFFSEGYEFEMFGSKSFKIDEYEVYKLE